MLRLHTGKRLRGRITRHKKVSIIVGSATGLVAAGGIAFGIAILGGQLTGSIQSNGNQPDVQWVGGAPAFTGCVDSEGNADSTATGTASVAGPGGGAGAGKVGPNVLTVSLANVYADEVCTFTGYVDDLSSTPVYVNAVDLTATSLSTGVQTSLTTTLSGAPVYLTADPDGSGAVQITFNVMVPDITTPDGYSVSGGLDFSVAGPPASVPSGWNLTQGKTS